MVQEYRIENRWQPAKGQTPATPKAYGDGFSCGYKEINRTVPQPGETDIKIIVPAR